MSSRDVAAQDSLQQADGQKDSENKLKILATRLKKVQLYHVYTVKREMLVAIIFGGFENITIEQKFNLEILLEKSVWGPFGDY